MARQFAPTPAESNTPLRINFVLPAELRDDFIQLCKDTDRTGSVILRDLIRAAVAAHKNGGRYV